MSSNDVVNCSTDEQFSHVTQNATPMGSSVDLQQSSGSGQGNRFMGQKERRKSSSVKMFLGDNLSLSTNQVVLKMLAKNGTTSFMILVLTINVRYQVIPPSSSPIPLLKLTKETKCRNVRSSLRVWKNLMFAFEII